MTSLPVSVAFACSLAVGFVAAGVTMPRTNVSLETTGTVTPTPRVSAEKGLRIAPMQQEMPRTIR
jgi:hypothetical protein